MSMPPPWSRIAVIAVYELWNGFMTTPVHGQKIWNLMIANRRGRRQECPLFS